MRRKIKNLVTAAFGICFCGAVSAGIVGLNRIFAVKAEETYGLAPENFYVRGASVRLIEDEYGPGIKFHVVIDEEIYNALPDGATTGTVVLPEKLLAEGDALAKDTRNAESRDTTELWFENAEGKMESVVYVYDIPEAYYGADIAVVGYVTAGEATVYTETASVSMAWIAQEEYNDENAGFYRDDRLEEYFTFTLSYEGEPEQTVHYGDKLDAPESPAVPEGMRFAGWVNKNGVLWNFENDVITGNTILFPKFIDASFGAERGDGYYWLSNFDGSGTAAMFEGNGVSWNGGACGAATYEYTSQNTGSNKDIETKGISIRMPGTYGSVKYNLPENFDLSGVQSLEFVLRQNGNATRGNAVSLMLTCGDKIYTISGKMTNVKKAEGAGDLWSSMLGNPLSFSINCAHIGFDVQKYLTDIEETLGGTVIDGIIICVNTKAQNADGTYDVVILDEIFYSRVSLSVPANLRCEQTEAGCEISWDEVENAESYEVLIDGEPASDYEGGTSFILKTSGVVSVTAKANNGSYVDSAAASRFFDVSFLSKRDANTVWLSNFDDSGTAAMFEGNGVSWNGGACGAATYEYTSQNTGSNKDIETKGISIRMPGTYGSVKYNLPENFDLSGVQSFEFVLRQNGNAARGNAVSLMLTCGDKIYTISGKMTNVKKAEGAGDLWSSMLGNPLTFGINCAHVGFDVQKYLTDIEETLGGTVIDGIIICVNTKAQNADGTYDVVILDEIFYSRVSVVTDSEAQTAAEASEAAASAAYMPAKKESDETATEETGYTD